MQRLYNGAEAHLHVIFTIQVYSKHFLPLKDSK